MNLSPSEKEAYEQFIVTENETLFQFDVQQIRPSYVGLLRLAEEAQQAPHMRDIDIHCLGFETSGLINYTFLLEKKLEKYEARKKPDSSGWWKIGEGGHKTFIRDVSSFFERIFSR